jgi:hypothetical protein
MKIEKAQDPEEVSTLTLDHYSLKAEIMSLMMMLKISMNKFISCKKELFYLLCGNIRYTHSQIAKL